jgi:signal transduction histidine kinase
VDKLRNTSNPAMFDKNPVKSSTADFIKLDTAITELMIRINDLLSKEREITINISHELLTPVSVIKAKLENIIAQEDITAQTSVKLEESLRTLNRLKNLINSLLFLSRVDNQLYLKEDVFDISEIVKEVHEELLPLAIYKGINFSIEEKSRLFMQEANRPLIFSMIYNVVTNAIKNTNKGGCISVKSLKEKDHHCISVSDTGNGIETEALKNLFSRNSRRDVLIENSNGIGLAITKSIADFHHINIEVDTETGKGTTFFFRIPVNS